MASPHPSSPQDFVTFPLRTLNPTTKRIVTLLATGNHTQSQTARIVGVSRQYVAQVVKKFLDLGLLKPSPRTADKNKWFEASSSLRHVLESGAFENLYSCRVPHVRVKYCYIVDAPLVLDSNSPSQTFYIKSWNPRGGPRHKFIVPGSIGIAIDVHPGCIIAYPVAGQNILVETIEDGDLRAKVAIHDAVHAWAKKQGLFGRHITLSDPTLTCNHAPKRQLRRT